MIAKSPVFGLPVQGKHLRHAPARSDLYPFGAVLPPLSISILGGSSTMNVDLTPRIWPLQMECMCSELETILTRACCRLPPSSPPHPNPPPAEMGELPTRHVSPIQSPGGGLVFVDALRRQLTDKDPIVNSTGIVCCVVEEDVVNDLLRAHPDLGILADDHRTAAWYEARVLRTRTVRSVS
ncbi:hypothetical protein B0H10DRAFT_1939510 [Mycena sp. CBHHK59/15]|nr:hypothetical protein B0H10DRAFT_1939510 [Mycena sp. CBHHK59/15]